MAGKHFHEDVKQPIKQDEAKKKKSKRKSDFLSILLTFIGVTLLAVAAFLFARDWYKYKTLDASIEQQQAYVQIVDENQPPTIDWEGLKKAYPDVVGWIYVPGTVINYPVVQGSTNDTYLHHLPDGASNDGGAIFLDSANIAPGMMDQHTILYGHHMKNGTMFKRIADMQTEELFNSVKTIWYITEHKTYELEPVFFYLSNGSDAGIRTFEFANKEAFDRFFISRIQDNMPHIPDAVKKIQSSDRMLSLSTCNYDLTDGRAELVCALKNAPEPQQKDAAGDQAESTESQAQSSETEN